MKLTSSLRFCRLVVRTILIATVLALTSPARAQERLQSGDSLAALHPGLHVTIVDDTGRKTKGIVKQVSESTLQVETRGVTPVSRTFT